MSRFIDQHIVRFQIPMNYIIIMQILHCQYYFTNYKLSYFVIKSPKLLQLVPQVSMFQILHTKTNKCLMSENEKWLDHKIPLDQFKHHILIFQTFNIIVVILFCKIYYFHSINILSTLFHHFPNPAISSFTNLL